MQRPQSRSVGRVDSNVIDSDLLMCDTWGCDCYTRSLIQNILLFNGVSSSEIDLFFQFSFYPVMNLIAKEYAHDMR